MTEPDFLALWNRVAPYLAVVAANLARPLWLDADDLLSAAALELWKNRGKLAGPDPDPLTVTIGRYAMLTARRKEMRHPLCARNLTPREGDRDPLDLVAGRETEPHIDEFAELLALADDRDRYLLRRRYKDGTPVDDLAAEQNVTVTRIQQKLSRAAERLLALLR